MKKIFFAIALFISLTAVAQHPTQAERDSAKAKARQLLGLDTVGNKLDSFRINIWAAILTHQHQISDINGLTLALTNRPTNQTLQDSLSAVRSRLESKVSNIDNTSDANKPVSTAQQTALNLKAPLANPTFTGTVNGVTAAMVGLGNVNNTSDLAKPISTLTQTALDGKATTSHSHAESDITNLVNDLAAKSPVNSPTFTGSPTGPSYLATGTGGVGYSTGAGGTITQSGNKTTSVTLNKTVGQITTATTSIAAGAETSFTLNNSTIGANDVVVVSIKSGGTAAAYTVGVSSTAAGSCVIVISNLSAGALGEALVISFAVIKGSAN